MAYRNLRDFLDTLTELDEVRRVSVEVDPVLEVAAITDRVCKTVGGGKALWFERLTGSPFPVVTNLFGSTRRICAALGVGDLEELTRRMERQLQMSSAPSLPEKLTALVRSPEYAGCSPLLVTEGECQQVMEREPDLDRYPVLKSWPGDGGPDNPGRFITLPLVFTRDPATGRTNCGMYRVELLGPSTVAIHWGATRGGASHYEQYRLRGEPMPVAIAVGGDPAVILSASLPLPEPLEEMQFAGFLRRQPVEMVRCLTSELRVPAGAEIVIEGYLTPGELVRGGAFGNHTGHCVPGGEVPLMHVTAISRQTDCIYPATVVGRPPMEDCYLARAWERLLVPLLRVAVPGVKDIFLPFEGIFHGCAVVAIDKTHSDHPREVMKALWEGNWLGEGRLIVVVDGDEDPADLSSVAWRAFNAVVWERDIVFGENMTEDGKGCRLGIDATRKGEDGGERHVSAPLAHDPAVVERVKRRWQEYGL